MYIDCNFTEFPKALGELLLVEILTIKVDPYQLIEAGWSIYASLN